MSPLSLSFLNLLGQLWDSVEQVGNEPMIGDLEDWRISVLVDSNNQLRLLHTSQMLNGSGNTDSNVKLWGDNLKSELLSKKCQQLTFPVCPTCNELSA